MRSKQGGENVDDIERWKLMAWLGFGIWLLVLPWLSLLMYRTLQRRGGPFTVGNALSGTANLAKAGFYLFVLYNLNSPSARWVPEVILSAVIFQGLIQLWLCVAMYMGARIDTKPEIEMEVE